MFWHCLMLGFNGKPHILKKRYCEEFLKRQCCLFTERCQERHLTLNVKIMLIQIWTKTDRHKSIEVYANYEVVAAQDKIAFDKGGTTLGTLFLVNKQKRACWGCCFTYSQWCDSLTAAYQVTGEKYNHATKRPYQDQLLPITSNFPSHSCDLKIKPRYAKKCI